MEAAGILKSVSHSDWASLLVIVPKPDGRIRICGDYKNTVNPVIEDEIFPISTPDELFVAMEGTQKFSKIDLSQAYMQVVLDDDSRKYLVLNTSKGLMEPTRMPHSIKPATAIFQSHITSALSSTPSTVTGMTPAKLLFGREMNTRLDCLKPKLSISCMQEPNLSKDVRSLEVGDIAKIRNYADKRKWISGVIFRKIGSKM